MKRIIAAVLLLFFVGAAGISVRAEKRFPLEFTDDGLLDYPDHPTMASLEVPQTVETLEELAFGIDASLYLASPGDSNMVYFTLSEELKEEASQDVNAFVTRVLQISFLGHNFCSVYNDSDLEQGLLGFQIEMPLQYANRASDREPSLPVLNYEFYRNSLQGPGGSLTLTDLPLFQKNLMYLPAENSEQLLFALQYGFLPLCEPDSAAGKLLCRAMEILARITNEEMTETERYRAIYQYVEQSCQYDYDTLLDIHLRSWENRGFFLEGALLDGKAVCDGLCKELVLLARLSGLEAFHVGASGEGSGHAYVYVHADGQWYLSCPTYGSNRYIRDDGLRMDYYTQNYMLTDFDTNMEGWPYDSEAFEEIEDELRKTKPYDYWEDTRVEIEGKICDFHPDTVEEALFVLEDACKLQQQLSMPVEVELCGKVSILREAYRLMKEQCRDLIYLSGGAFESQRLQIYLFGGES